MKDTGIIRKIDDLGRIVIPKEIRKTFNLDSGDDIEIYLEQDKIILKKYQMMLGFKDNAQKYIIIFSKLVDLKIFITDKEKIVASLKDEEIGKEINNRFKESMIQRKIIESDYFDNDKKHIYYQIVPIIVDADSIGSIIITSFKELNASDKLISKIINKLLIEDNR